MATCKYLSCVVSVLSLSLLLSSPIAAQDKESEKKATDNKAEPTQRDARYASPKATMRTFLTAMNQGRKEDGALCFEGVTEQNASQHVDNASYLKDVIDRIVRINYGVIPEDPDYFEPYNLRMMLEQVANSDSFTEQDLTDAEKIVIRQGKDKLWRFSQDTIDSIADLWHSRLKKQVVEGVDEQEKTAIQAFNAWLVSKFPDRMLRKRFLIHDYQWYCLAVVILFGFFLDLLVRWLMNFLTELYFRRIREQTEFQIRPNLWKPLGLLTQATIWYWGTRLLLLPERLHQVLRVGLQFFAVFAAIWTIFHMIGVLTDYLAKRAEATESKFDDLLIPLVSKSLRFISVCIGILLFADVFGFDWKVVIGGLGLGGMALALAAKDTLANFFGSVMVLLDHPFEIGDWIVTDSAEGTVESVGLRSTRIRTFYDSVITLPNSQLTTAKVDNMGKRRYRRITHTLHLDVDTKMDQVDAFCEGVREILRRHPYTRKDYYHVYMVGVGEWSFEVMLYCFVECPDWSIELREKHRLFSDIVRLASELKIRIAVPTRALHMQQHTPLESEPIDDPSATGQRMGAQLAGSLLGPSERPGAVQFTGPTPIAPAKRGRPG